jgi:4-amino-4-deoxy-L-arabinose transferase-like glycosyltransferase
LSRASLHTRAPLWALFGLALTVRLLTAWFVRQPGYADAYYYAVGARQLYTGQGFSEPFIWNWLDPPDSLPHPGYLYWMPLTAILGWLGMALLGNSFRAIQAPFVLASALLPLVSYGLAWDLTGKRRHALLAGLLAVFPGFYAHVFVLPDNFGPFALTGSVCLWAAGRGLRNGRAGWFGLAGLAAGLGHLARADGLLLLGVALLAAIARLSKKPFLRACLLPLASCLLGYLLVMGPWFIRNWLVFGMPLPGAGTLTMFLTSYDGMFTYGQPPTLQTYLDWGWAAILKSKGEALLLNMQRLWVEGLLIILLPFAIAGLVRLRRERLLWPFLGYLLLLFLSMTVVFTFPGMRGGLFHSGAALLPFFFAVTGPGLEAMLQGAARRFRGWQVRQAWTVFGTALVALAACITVFALWRAGALTGTWNEREQEYATISNWLLDKAAAPDVIVMVGDAPGFAWHTGHLAIAVPNNPLDTVVDVARRYGARYVVLDSTRPRTTDSLYTGQISHPSLALRFVTGPQEQPTKLYEVLP